MIQAQQKATLDIMYRSLYDYLDLPQDQMEAFKELLVNKQMAQVDLGIEMLDGSMSYEGREELEQRIEALTAEADEQIKTLLGEEEFEMYKAYEETQPERMQVNMFKQAVFASLDIHNEYRGSNPGDLIIDGFDRNLVSRIRVTHPGCRRLVEFPGYIKSLASGFTIKNAKLHIW